MKKFWADTDELLDSYTKCCRSILEYALPVWHSSITAYENNNIERVQKMAVHLLPGEKYKSYGEALEMASLDTLESRRTRLYLDFAKKAEKSKKLSTGLDRKLK